MAETLRIDISGSMIKRTNISLIGMNKTMEKVMNTSKKTSNTFGVVAEKLSKFDESIQKTYEKLEKVANGTYEIVLSIIDNITPTLDLITGKLKTIDTLEKDYKCSLTVNDNSSSVVEGILNRMKALSSGTWILSLEVLDSASESIKGFITGAIAEVKRIYGELNIQIPESKVENEISEEKEVKFEIYKPSYQSKSTMNSNSSISTIGTLNKVTETLGSTSKLVKSLKALIPAKKDNGDAGSRQIGATDLEKATVNKSASASSTGTGINLNTVVNGLATFEGLASAVDNFKKASSAVDDAQKSKEVRTGVVKTGIMAAGTAVGMAIPGVGPLIGAGMAAMASSEYGDAISDWIGELVGAKDKQQEILSEIGLNLSNSLMEYNAITEGTDYAKNLITDYEELSGAIEKGEIPTEDLAAANERLNEVSQKLHELFPDLISEYDLISGKVGPTLDAVKGEVEKLDAVAKMNLEQDVFSTRQKLPEYQDNLNEWNSKRDTQVQEWQNQHDFSTGLYEAKVEFELILNNKNSSDDQIATAELAYRNAANQLSEDNNMDYYFNHMGGVDDILNKLQNSSEKSLEKIADLDSKISETEQTLQDYYNGNIALINDQYKVNVEQASAYLTTLDNAVGEYDKSGTISDATLSQVQEIIPEFKLDPENVEATRQQLTDAFAGITESTNEAMKQVEILNNEAGLPIEKIIDVKIIQEPIYINLSSSTSPSGNQPKTNGPLAPKTYAAPALSTYGSIADKFGTKNTNAHRANGGIEYTPLISMIAEDGPESIIPLSGKRKNRGIQLWEQTGKILGVFNRKEQKEISTSSKASQVWLRDETNRDIGEMLFSGDKKQIGITNGLVRLENKNNSDDSTNISFNVSMSPSFSIGGENTDENSIVQVIKAHIREMTDDIGDEIAERLHSVFSNMPLKEA